MENKELQFVRKLEEVKKTAKKQGFMISAQQVEEAFSQLSLAGEQMELVYDYLKKHKIGIGESVDPDEYLTKEEASYLGDYLEELKQMKPVSDPEKDELIRQAMAGEHKAQSVLAQLYLPHVAEIARLYTGQGVLLEDLIGEGNVAVALGVSMLGSLENERDADGMMAQMIMEAMEEAVTSNVEIQQKEQEAADKVNRIAQQARLLSEELGKEVTVKELAQETGMSGEEILDAVKMSGGQISFIKIEEKL